MIRGNFKIKYGVKYGFQYRLLSQKTALFWCNWVSLTCPFLR
jgi:hypothetical protein